MDISVVEILILVTSVTAAIYYYLVSNYGFWEKRGVPGPKPTIVIGSTMDLINNKESVGTYARKMYERYPSEPMVGIYVLRKPVVILNDVELIKSILIKDFNTFVDRGVTIDEKNDPLSASLFSLEAKRWRPLRAKLSPMFTSGKLRDMFYLLRQCSLHLEKYLEQADGTEVDVRDITAKFSTDVIGVCAFGIQMNALEDEDSVFRKMGRRIFTPTWKALLRFKFQQFSPIFNRIFGRWLQDEDLTSFFVNLTRDTLEYRRKNNVVRHDFIDLLRELKAESGKFDDIELTDMLMAAQLFVFFVAGFETSSSTMSNAIFELAQNHGIQDKLREEIREELDRSHGEMTYEGIKSMKYLDMVVKETLRKYPPLPVLMRESNAPYTFPGTEVSIPAGVGVWIPIFGIQRDSKYFPNPDVFDPARFTEEAVKRRPQMSFLSFGDGPRNCIGARFGTVQTKVGLVKIISKFKVDVCDKTDLSYELEPKAFLLMPKNGIVVKISRVS